LVTLLAIFAENNDDIWICDAQQHIAGVSFTDSGNSLIITLNEVPGIRNIKAIITQITHVVHVCHSVLKTLEALKNDLSTENQQLIMINRKVPILPNITATNTA